MIVLCSGFQGHALCNYRPVTSFVVIGHISFRYSANYNLFRYRILLWMPYSRSYNKCHMQYFPALVSEKRRIRLPAVTPPGVRYAQRSFGPVYYICSYRTDIACYIAHISDRYSSSYNIPVYDIGRRTNYSILISG